MKTCSIKIASIASVSIVSYVSSLQEYLSRYFSEVGVSAPNTVWRSSLDSFDDALRKMQEYFGLEVTGELDSSTLEVMARPRCGFTDVHSYSHFEDKPKWLKPLVTYRYSTAKCNNRGLDRNVTTASVL